uniref:Uncharacterized protein n=1 Tax=Oryza glaberrima TaxID=4538 RepID=I1Q0R6_ORYGL
GSILVWSNTQKSESPVLTWGKFLHTWTRLVRETRRNTLDDISKDLGRFGLEMEPTGKIVVESLSYQAVGSP